MAKSSPSAPKRALPDRATHTYSVNFPDMPGPGAIKPIEVEAERFEQENDTLTFYSEGDPCAVVRGPWVSVIQKPDPEPAPEG